MTKSDIQSLYLVIVAFFLQGDKQKRNELLTRAHDMVDNIERDLESLSVEGVPRTHTVEQFREILQQSRSIVENFG